MIDANKARIGGELLSAPGIKSDRNKLLNLIVTEGSLYGVGSTKSCEV